MYKSQSEYINVYCFCSTYILGAFGSPAGIGGSVRGGRGAELLSHRLHPTGQWELRSTADLSGEDCQGHLQVHGHLHPGLSGVHDWHVQPVLLLPWGKAEWCLHHVRDTCICSHMLLGFPTFQEIFMLHSNIHCFSPEMHFARDSLWNIYLAQVVDTGCQHYNQKLISLSQIIWYDWFSEAGWL